MQKNLPDSTAARGLTPHDELVEEAVAGDGEASTSAASAHAGIAARAGDAEGSGQREPRAKAWAGEQVRFRRLFGFLRFSPRRLLRCIHDTACLLPAACCCWCAPSRSRLSRVRTARHGRDRDRDLRARHATAMPMRYL